MKPPFAYYGGKMTLAERIVDALPAHTHYVEPLPEHTHAVPHGVAESLDENFEAKP